MKKLIIDAHNISAGGGFAHLYELLTHIDTVEGGLFDTVEVVVSPQTGKKLPKFNKIIVRTPAVLGFGLKFSRIFWFFFFYTTLFPQRNTVLFSVGGFSFRRKSTLVLLQNVLPFHLNVRRLYPELTMRLKFSTLKFLYLFSSRFAERILFPSHIAYNSLIHNYPGLKQKSRVVHHGISRNIFLRAPGCLGNRDKIHKKEVIKLLYASVFTPYKRQFNLINDFLISDLDKLGVSLSFVGMISDEDKKKLDIVLDNCQGRGVQYLGHLKFTEMREVYEEHDILVFPSLIESFGIPMVKAAATNMWVIFSNPQFKEIMGINDYQRYSVAESDFCEKIREVIDLHRAGTIDLFDRHLNTGFRTFEDTAKETLMYLEEMIQDSK